MFEETADRLYQRYGDMVYVEAGTAPITDGSLDTPTQAVTNMHWQYVLIALFLLVILGTTLILNRRRYNYALHTSNGNTGYRADDQKADCRSCKGSCDLSK